jgi:hypothetical protein
MTVTALHDHPCELARTIVPRGADCKRRDADLPRPSVSTAAKAQSEWYESSPLPLCGCRLIISP